MYDKNNPFMATLRERRRLTHEGSDKETSHFVVDISGSGLSYTCGDSLGVFARNRRREVEAVLAALGATGDEQVELKKEPEPLPLREALSSKLSLKQPTPKFLKALLARVTDEGEKTRLRDMLEPEEKANALLYLEQREFADLLEEYPSARFEAQEFVAELRRQVPRLYSIASSPTEHPEEIHLTVAVVRYVTNGRDRVGVASTFLADRAKQGEADVPVFVASSHFGLPPEPGKDIIMVGPGTGVAPFRSFLRERALSGDSGRNWLFFGERHRETDYLYGEELDRMFAEGQLNRLDLAFSRDQPQKIYVQHRMLESAGDLWEWINGGACFYVCGDAKHMAKDVEAALLQIFEEVGGMSSDEAKDYLKTMRKEKRYQKDVY